MAGTYLGCSKSAATKIGMPLDLYIARRAAGERYCYSCRGWKSDAEFYAGPRAQVCRQCSRVKAKRGTMLTDSEVRLLRQLRWIGRIPYQSLAKMFGKSYRAVWAVCNGETRAKLPMPWECKQ